MRPLGLPADANQASVQVSDSAGGKVRLGSYPGQSVCRGRSCWLEACWLAVQGLLVASPLPGSLPRVLLLRLFGARIGERVVIKPRVRIKFPWRLQVGDDVWIGEGAWIDNWAEVRIESDCCVSQDVYVCTGNHDWGRATFDLIVEPVTIERGAWLTARSIVGPGVTVREGAVLCLGSVATEDLHAWRIHRGAPAVPVRERSIHD